MKSFLADKNNKVDEIYPVVHTPISFEEKIQPLLNYTVNTAWNLLDGQGYDMQSLSTYFTEVWCQSHRKYSSMDYHMHGDCQMTAFILLSAQQIVQRWLYMILDQVS
jgi:hypothetical protein